MTEEQARESGADIQVVTLPVAAIPRARVMNDTRGVLKAIVDNKTQRMLGASLLCVDSHEMINIVKMVMDAGLPYSRCQKACVLPENPASYRVVRTKSYLFNKAYVNSKRRSVD